MENVIYSSAFKDRLQHYPLPKSIWYTNYRPSVCRSCFQKILLCKKSLLDFYPILLFTFPSFLCQLNICYMAHFFSFIFIVVLLIDVVLKVVFLCWKCNNFVINLNLNSDFFNIIQFRQPSDSRDRVKTAER